MTNYVRKYNIKDNARGNYANLVILTEADFFYKEESESLVPLMCESVVNSVKQIHKHMENDSGYRAECYQAYQNGEYIHYGDPLKDIVFIVVPDRDSTERNADLIKSALNCFYMDYGYTERGWHQVDVLAIHTFIPEAVKTITEYAAVAVDTTKTYTIDLYLPDYPHPSMEKEEQTFSVEYFKDDVAQQLVLKPKHFSLNNLSITEHTPNGTVTHLNGLWYIYAKVYTLFLQAMKDKHLAGVVPVEVNPNAAFRFSSYTDFHAVRDFIINVDIQYKGFGNASVLKHLENAIMDFYNLVESQYEEATELADATKTIFIEGDGVISSIREVVEDESGNPSYRQTLVTRTLKKYLETHKRT